MFYLIFFPISLFFSKLYYNELKKKDIITWIKWFLKVFWFLIIIWVIFSSIWKEVIYDNSFKLFKVNWQTMFPTLYDKQFVLTNNFNKNYQRWDIVIYKDELGVYHSSRIIWLPWETLKIKDGNFYTSDKNNNLKKIEENYLIKKNKDITLFLDLNNYNINISEENYFMIWDNRNAYLWEIEAKRIQNYIVPKNSIVWKIYFDIGYFDINTMKYVHPKYVESEDSSKMLNTKPKFFNLY